MEEIKQYLTEGLSIAEKQAQRLGELLSGNTDSYAVVPPIDVNALKAEIAGTTNVVSENNPIVTEDVTETVLE